MSTSAYYNFIGAPPTGQAEPTTTTRADKQAAIMDEQQRRSPFANSSSSSSSLSQLNSLTQASSCSSSSPASDSSTTSASQSNFAPSSRKFDLMRQSSVTPSQSSINFSRPQMFHSYTLHSLEPKPLKPFKSRNEYLEAMKEDLAEWLTRLYPDLDLTADNFFAQLETGSIICRHANNVTQMGRTSMIERQQSQRATHHKSARLEESSNGSETSPVEPNNNSICSSPDSHIESESAHGSDTNIQTNDDCSFSSNSSTAAAPARSSRRAMFSAGPMVNRAFSRFSMSSSPASLGNTVGSLSPPNCYHKPDRGNINWFMVKTIQFKQDANPGTFFARDNICQFILWCRSLNIIECLLFETDDLVARKNEKSFILCLLEVARIGFKVGMPTPLIIQLEQEIDREIENDAKLQKQLVEKQSQDADQTSDSDDDRYRSHKEPVDGQQSDYVDKLPGSAHNEDQPGDREAVCKDGLAASFEKLTFTKSEENQSNCSNEDEGVEEEAAEEDDAEEEEETGPKPQVITNDLVSLHEKVVQLLCQCTCPTQFPMVRIGDGKYKVGDKLIIFVRILRRHIMVRVGGGWQELSEFLRQKDPCRTKQHQYQTASHQSQHHSLQQVPSPYQQQQQQQQSLTNQQPSRLPSLTRSRLVGSSQHLNKGHHLSNQQNSAIPNATNGNNNHHQHNGRNSGIQRFISSSASMSWLSHNAL